MCKSVFSDLICNDVDINECKTKKHRCHRYAVCHNTIGNYTCKCKRGFKGNGYQCKRKYKCVSAEPCVLIEQACRFPYHLLNYEG